MSRESLEYRDLLEAWQGMRRLGKVVLHELALPNCSEPLLFGEIRPAAQKQIVLAAGAHGDEPITPWALLDLVRNELLDDAYGYRLWCCMNPDGYLNGTRVNAAGRDINRSYGAAQTTCEAEAIMGMLRRLPTAALLLDLHEDFESDGFYLYEPIVDGTAPFGQRVLTALQEAGFRLQELHPEFDIGYPFDSEETLHTVEFGRVLPHVERECAAFAGALPLTMWALQQKHVQRTMTFESPRRLPWSDRLAIHRLAVVEAIEAFTVCCANGSLDA